MGVSDDVWDDRYKMAREGAYDDDEDPPYWYPRMRSMEIARQRRKIMRNERDLVREELTIEES